MKTKLLFSIFCLLVAIHVANADTPTFTFTSTSSSINFILESSNSTCLIDWGDGTLVTQFIPSGITNSAAYLPGATVKVYDSGINKIIFTNSYLTSIDVTNASNLEFLDCSSNQLTSLDLTQNTLLTNLIFDNNQLTSLDLTNNTALTNLYCLSNQLTSLDLTHNTALTDLYCSSNQLTSLNLSQNASLSNLLCDNNQLTSLDITHDAALTYVYCPSNQLTSLDVTQNIALKYLYCMSNQLTSLDLTNNIALTGLNCSSNLLTILDLTNNTALTDLYCSSNQLTSLDLSKNTTLRSLFCSSNQLVSLNVTNNTLLQTLNCSSNQLTSLDVTHDSGLIELYCSSNQLTSLDVTHNATLLILNNSNNLLNYATLPQPIYTSYNYIYSPQQEVQVAASAYVVDLSSQLTAIDKNNTSYTTVYKWYKQDGTLLVSGTDYTESNGVFTFSPSLTDVYCKMTNGAFPYMSGSDVLRTVDIALGGTSGVNSLSNQHIAVYPNPAATSFSVEGLQKEGVIKIYDVTGKKVIEKTIAPKEEISVSGWNKGVYIVKLNGMTSKLIVK